MGVEQLVLDAFRAVNAEFGLKAGRGFTTAEYFWTTDEQDNPVAAADIRSRASQ